MNLRVLLFDVEGTTTPITFVYDVLFPYARARLLDFCIERWDELAGVAKAASASDASGLAHLAAEAMAQDRKLGWLKELQGRIWETGYRRGEIQGALFPDVAPCFRGWRQQGLDLCIYSSGSVLAQQLLFGHSEAGDLRPLIRDYFDTGVGAKGEAESYRTIAEKLGYQPCEGLFATDVLKEADAAAEAGWNVVLMLRPGNLPQPSNHHPQCRDFPSLLEVCAKEQ